MVAPSANNRGSLLKLWTVILKQLPHRLELEQLRIFWAAGQQIVKSNSTEMNRLFYWVNTSQILQNTAISNYDR